MMDEGGRPFRSEAPGEQMRSQISLLSPLRRLLAAQPQRQQTQVRHTHTQTHTFYHFLLPFISTAVVKVVEPVGDGVPQVSVKIGAARLDSENRSPGPGLFLVKGSFSFHCCSG